MSRVAIGLLAVAAMVAVTGGGGPALAVDQEQAAAAAPVAPAAQPVPTQAPAPAPTVALVKPVNRCANNYVCDLLIEDYFPNKAEIIKAILRAIDMQVDTLDETREMSWSKLRNAQWAMAALGGVTTAGVLLRTRHPILIPISVVAGALITTVAGYHGLIDYPRQASVTSASLAKLRTLRSRINYEVFKAVYFDDKGRISEERIDEWYREFNRIAPDGSGLGVPTPED